MGLVLVFALFVSLWTSIWQARARDARFAVRYTLAFWMYLHAGDLSALDRARPHLRWLLQLNPLTAPIETFRWALLSGLEHSWAWFGYSVGRDACATFLVGRLVLHAFRERDDG